MDFILLEEKTGTISLNYINFYPTRVDNWILVLSLWKTFYLRGRGGGQTYEINDIL
jgi:hypothetical protein